MNNKCQWLKILSWIFFISAGGQSVYHALVYGRWWGLIVLGIGFIFGLLYGKIRKNNNDDRTCK